MAAHVPHADLHVVAGAGHAAQLEAPAAVARLLGGR
jgi:pimeloyl-ACP methyl ester carboxylesterase